MPTWLTWFNFFMWCVIVVLIVIPPEWDLAIRWKERNERRKQQLREPIRWD